MSSSREAKLTQHTRRERTSHTRRGTCTCHMYMSSERGRAGGAPTHAGRIERSWLMEHFGYLREPVRVRPVDHPFRKIGYFRAGARDPHLKHRAHPTSSRRRPNGRSCAICCWSPMWLPSRFCMLRIVLQRHRFASRTPAALVCRPSQKSQCSHLKWKTSQQTLNC